MVNGFTEIKETPKLEKYIEWSRQHPWTLKLKRNWKLRDRSLLTQIFNAPKIRNKIQWLDHKHALDDIAPRIFSEIENVHRHLRDQCASCINLLSMHTSPPSVSVCGGFEDPKISIKQS